MSEDVRKHIRTQGKYSDTSFHSDDRGNKSRDKKQKVSLGAKETSENKVHKRNSYDNKGAYNSSVDERISPLKYEENSDYSYSQTSEDVRKHIRTQGKYSDTSFHSDDRGNKSRDKKQKVSLGAKETSENKVHKRNSYDNKGAYNSSVDEGISPIKYEENSDFSFRQLGDVKKPIEIAEPGKHVLSTTENGESVILFKPDFINEPEANKYFDNLNQGANWHSKNIVINGVEYPQPRLVAWYGPFSYSYSGATLEPEEMPTDVLEIKQKVEEYLKRKGIEVKFNSVLLNKYRDGKDSVAWHSDDELTMGISPTIASVSLGETRKFEMRRKIKNYEEENSSQQMDEYLVHLTHGSLIIMTGCMQDDWQHRVPKEYHDKYPRINLTFRTVYPLKRTFSRSTEKHSRKRHFRNTSWSESPRKRIRLHTNEFQSPHDSRASSSKSSNKSYNAVRGSSSTSQIDRHNVPSSKEQSTSDLYALNSTPISRRKRRFSWDIKSNSDASVNKYENWRLENLLNCEVDLMRGESLLNFAFTLKETVLKNILKLRVSEREEFEFLCKLTDETESQVKHVTKRMQSVFKNAVEKHETSDFQKLPVVPQFSEKAQCSNSLTTDKKRHRNDQKEVNRHGNSTDDTADSNDEPVSRAVSVKSTVEIPQTVEAKNIKHEN